MTKACLELGTYYLPTTWHFDLNLFVPKGDSVNFLTTTFTYVTNEDIYFQYVTAHHDYNYQTFSTKTAIQPTKTSIWATEKNGRRLLTRHNGNKNKLFKYDNNTTQPYNEENNDPLTLMSQAPRFSREKLLSLPKWLPPACVKVTHCG